MLETQIAQLAQERASISGNAVQNPAHDHHPINAVVLRSGTTLKGPQGNDRVEASPTKADTLGSQVEQEGGSEEGNEKGEDKEVPEKVEKGKEKQVEERPYRPPMPYPYAWAERKMSDKFKKFLEMMKTLQVNVPFLQAMAQMPLYAKFLKDLLTNKSRLEEAEVITLPQQVSALVQGTLPKKESDPGSFTLPVRIGNMEPLGGLADLGAGPNLMPLSIARKLPYELQTTRKTIQLADRTIKAPCGQLIDIPIMVGHVLVPCDFIVMDMEEDPYTPLILGRGALKTLNAVINCRKDTITVEVAREKVVFEFSKTMRQPMIEKVCRVSIVESELEVFSGVMGTEDALYDIISGGNLGYGEEAANYKKILDEAQACEQKEDFLPLPSIGEEPEGSSKPPPEVELKPLPPSLKYAYLDNAKHYPIIVNENLDNPSLEKLLNVLRRYKGVIGYSIDDIKGISPSLVMHRIHLDDPTSTSIEPQRRLNPSMKEVVEKEITKLRKAGIIYRISDSKWVSPVHVVPKKGGFTVTRGEDGQMISTRLPTGWRVCIDYRKLNKATRKDHFPLPFIDQMLERLSRHSHFCFLDGYSGFFQIPIHPEDQEKTTFTCPFGTFAYRRMPFGLCNAPSTFQRCMTYIFFGMLEESVEVFMDDFSVGGSSFDACLSNLELALVRCQKANLVLNWEKCHFMVEEGIVLGHKISKNGIEVDPAKVAAIEKLPPPTSVTGVRAFLGHAGFYRRFIKGFSQIARPLTLLLQKDVNFVFDDSCFNAFIALKKALVSVPIVRAPD